MSDRRFDITGLQVTASVLATVTGTIAASYLGVTGTIIGAAVMSIASTAGSAFYKHYLGRTSRRIKVIKEATPAAAHRAAERMHTPAQQRAHGRTIPGRTTAGRAAPDQTAADGTVADDTVADGAVADGTVVRRAATDRTAAGVTAPDATGPGGPPSQGTDGRTVTASGQLLPVRPGPGGGPERGEPGDSEPTAVFHRPDGTPIVLPSETATAAYTSAGPEDPAGPGGPDDPAGPGNPHHGPGWLHRRPGWVLATVAALAMFVGVVGAVTVFEVAAGKPLEAVVWHRSGSGTTVGGVVGGQSSPSPTPSPTPTRAQHTSRPSATPSPTGTNTGSASPSPSPSPSSGSPSPTSGSGSPSPSSSPSPSRSAGSPSPS